MIEDYVERMKGEQVKGYPQNLYFLIRQKSGIVTAFYSAYFSRIEKLSSSDLEKVLAGIDNEPEQSMTSEQMYSVMKRLSGS